MNYFDTITTTSRKQYAIAIHFIGGQYHYSITMDDTTIRSGVTPTMEQAKSKSISIVFSHKDA